MNALQKARTQLLAGGCTLVLCRGDEMITDTRRGVAPLLAILDACGECRGFSAADKVVGKGAAFLYCLLGVDAVYAAVISESALAVLQQGGIAVEYGCCVPYIQNRTGEGRCPIEQAVLEVVDPDEALALIRRRLQQLQSQS